MEALEREKLSMSDEIEGLKRKMDSILKEANKIQEKIETLNNQVNEKELEAEEEQQKHLQLREEYASIQKDYGFIV